MAAEKKIGATKAEFFCKAFEEAHEKLVYKELNLDAAKKFLSAYESWWWNYRQMLLEDPQVPMIRCNWLEVVDAVEVGRLATFADNRRHLLVAYIFFGLFYSPFLPSKEEKRSTHVFKVVD